MARLLVKTGIVKKDKKFQYYVFQDYHNGDVFHYHKENGSLEGRVPIGGNVLSDVTKGHPWTQPGTED